MIAFSAAPLVRIKLACQSRSGRQSRVPGKITDDMHSRIAAFSAADREVGTGCGDISGLSNWPDLTVTSIAGDGLAEIA